MLSLRDKVKMKSSIFRGAKLKIIECYEVKQQMLIDTISYLK